MIFEKDNNQQLFDYKQYTENKFHDVANYIKTSTCPD
jgi:hypothetical protein